jgi:hypothetical protein
MAGQVTRAIVPPQTWRQLRSLAEEWARHGGYTIDLAVRLAQETRTRLAECGAGAEIDWRPLGIRVERRVLSSSGMLVTRELPLRIWVNQNDDWRRQRFTVGHEVAHYLFPSSSVFVPGILERLCDAYSAELLLPETWVRSRLSATGDLASAVDVLDLARDARINIAPVLNQVARVAWNPWFCMILLSGGSSPLRVCASAGPEIGGPPVGQRLSSLGKWLVLATEEGPLIRRHGIADLAYRFIRSVTPGRQCPRSGHVSGMARWNSVELAGRRTIMLLYFLQPPVVRFSRVRAREMAVQARGI